MKRRAVARQLACVVINRDLEAVVSVAPILGTENQIVPNDPQGFKIGRASGAVPLVFKLAPFSAA
jgi:hypothetical protein